MDTATCAGADSATDMEQFLTFMLGKEEFGVEILRVQGIQGWGPVTPIPHSPDYVLGVTNLRGSIVPIVDLRQRFNLPDQEFGPTTVIIVVKIQGLGQDRVIGMVVDGVSDVYSVGRQDIQPSPDFGGNVDVRFVSGLATTDDRMLILLDVDQLLDDAECAEVSAASAAAD